MLANSKSNGNGTTINGTTINGTLNGGGRRSASRSNSVDLSNGKGPLVGGTNGNKKEYISCEQFTDYWKKYVENYC